MQTGYGRPLLAQLKAQISRELDRIELLMNQLKIVESERDALLEPAKEAAPTLATMLAHHASVRAPGVPCKSYRQGLAGS
jgi:transposase